MNFAIITVTYNSDRMVPGWAGAIGAAWRRFDPQAHHSLHTVVIDNHSTDGTLDALCREATWADVLALQRNVGFAAACNLGITRTPSDATVIFLNPDVQLDTGFFETLACLPWPPDVAAIGPRVIGRRGELEQSARRFPSAWTGLAGRQAIATKLFPSLGLVQRELLATAEPGGRDVDWVSGACMVTKRKTLDAVGGMDERYFMYWEDADWCRRAAEAGFGVRFEPSLLVRHDQGSSARQHPFRTIWRFHRSALRYYRVHISRSPIETAGACVALALRAIWRAALAMLRLLKTRR